MSRRERHERAQKDQNALVPTFIQAFTQGGLRGAQNELLLLKRSCPQRGSVYENAFHEMLRIARKGNRPVIA